MLLQIFIPLSAVASTELTRDDFIGIVNTHSVNPDILTYREYRGLHPTYRPESTVVIEASEYSRYEDDGFTVEPEKYTDFEGKPGVSVLTTETAIIEFNFTVPETGLYEVLFEYYPVEGKSSSIQRSIFIDGALPYREMALVELPRIWQNRQAIEQTGTDVIVWEKDNRGNDLKPIMVESPEWISGFAYDSGGYITQPLSLYLTAGSHTISLYSLREPMLLRSITLNNQHATPTYAQALAEWESLGASDTSGRSIVIGAEDAVRTSSQMLYPVQDQSSPAVMPASAKYFLNNTIGGNPWRLPGQWIEWEFTVPETGFYELTLHTKQNFRRGAYVSRKISLNGEVPFTELEDYGFRFSRHWRTDRLSDDEGTPFKFYIEAGVTNTLRIEAVLGDFGEIISTVRDCVYELNNIYRRVISRTGVRPDRFADYQIRRVLPELTSQMTAIRDDLTWVIEELRRVGGQSSERERILITMRDQLNVLIADNERFPRNVDSFRANVRACGAWLNEAMEQPLQLDAIFFHSPDTNVKIRNNTVFHRIWHEISRLFYSFIIDYNQVGNTSEEGEVITLWIGSGRDQANVIKALIDESFTRYYGINVNVMLVDMSTLLQASLAGQGPDVAIQVGSELPMNFGLRGSVVDLSAFDGFNEVRERFAESAMTPYEFEGQCFALPETQVFPMMFYRKDILAELNMELPNTWEDVSVIMSELAFNHMEFGMLPSEQIFTTLLFQNGGDYYNENKTRSALDSEEAIAAFRMYTEFYTDYKLDRATSVEERFRTGETPIIIADYTFYNNLQISAPDLKGIWGFAPVPGTRRPDGTIDRTVSSNGGGAPLATTMIGVTGGSGTACVMMSSTQMQEQVWQFMKWWTSADTQVRFGREMESLMGPAARVPTANQEAFSKLPWPAEDYRALRYQFQFVRGIPQVPGGYFTYRNINNAFYAVTTAEDDRSAANRRPPMPREALMDKIILINDEIRFKRVEFGLPLY
jgi:ABC-type glycerol-3-phosphate transport system substrate-binding protein